MNSTRCEELIGLIGEKNPLQKKYLEKLNESIDVDELIAFDALISYYIGQGETINSLADLYLHFINDLMEERYYFVKNNSYRYSSAKEVNERFYQNPKYMKMYMVGLALSTYLLTSHKEYMRWFKEKIKEYFRGGGTHGLRLAPGMGHILFML